MELNKEHMEMLKFMLEKNDYIKVEELSERYKLTNRAIRYKIDKIESFLVKNGFQYFEKAYKKGIKILDSEKVKVYLEEFAIEETPFKYSYSKEERILYITLKLLETNNCIKIKELEEKLCVSKNTLLKELDEIEENITKYNLQLVRKPRVGLLVDGSEIDKRNAVIDILSKSVSTEDVVNYVSKKSIQSKINNLQFDTLFADIDIDFIDGLIKKAEIELKREFSDDAYGGLITHLAIMVKRVQLNKVIYLPQIDDAFVKNTLEYKVAKEIIGKIENHYNIKVPEMEACYIVIHLLGAKVINDSFLDTDSEAERGLHDIIEKMISYVESYYKVELKEEKDWLKQGLLLHLRPSIYRIKYGSKIENPLFDVVKNDNKVLFGVVTTACKYLEEFIGDELGEHEISYIVLHFGAALAKYERRISEKVKVIIVCGSGIGASKMVAAKVQERFDVEIIGTYASRNIDNDLVKKSDFILSTIDIPHLNKDKYIKISPLMSSYDFEKLEKVMTPTIKKEDGNYEIKLVNRILDVVKKHSKINDEDQLKYELLYEIKKNNETDLTEKRKYSLIDFIKKENIELKLNCKDWKDAIRKAGSILINHGDVTEKYIENIIDKTDELGAYMVIAPGICLAHTDMPDEITRTSMSLINLKYPIKFNSEFNDPVKLILTFATKDKESHLNSLLEFMTILNNAKDLDRLINTSNKDEVIEILKKY